LFGSLDNFAPPNNIYDINADYKFVLDIPLNELMKRYYLRIYLEEQNVTRKVFQDYWKKLSEGIYNIRSSDDIIKDHKKYNDWHKKNNYIFLSDKQIINSIRKIIGYK
jgi:hypothetical protein